MLQGNKVWLTLIPSKVCFTVWLVVRNKILTHEVLRNRGFNIVPKCVLCGCSIEETDHIFAGCQTARGLWATFTDNRDPSTAQVSFIDRLLSWNPRALSVQGQIIKPLIPHAIVWVLWNERNRRVFDEVEVSFQRLVVSVKECAWSWSLGLPAMKDTRFEKLIFHWARL